LITSQTLVQSLHTMGVREGDVLLCHSSYKSFGDEVEGGPTGVATALIEAAGGLGSIFMPTFNFAQLPWKPGETASLTGVITDQFWRNPGVLRSLHPTHPLAGIGPIAAEVLAGHDQTHPFGADSPIWKLWQRNIWVLLIGVEHSSNSTVHVAEEEFQLPYVKRTRVQKVWREGQWTEITLRRPGDSNGFVNVGPVLEQMNAVKESYVGQSRFRLMRSQDVVRAVGQMVKQDKGALLCDEPHCQRCIEARQMIIAAAG
jgi:aminoglycoside 3-N-acetyltransferase